MRDENLSGEVVAAASQNIKERDYWLEKLGGKPERAFFPYDYPHAIHDGKMDILNFKLSGEIFSKLMQLSKRLDYTLHMILIAGIIGLLKKYTAANDIMVGSPIYKQKNEGRFINTLLVLRHQIKEVASFKELLLLVRQTLVEATEHQNYPLETLLYKLEIEHDESEFPLFDIAILLENIHDKKYLRDVNINMIFSFLRTGNSIEGTVEYNPQRYLRQSVEKYSDHLINFFKEALFNIDMQMDNIEILSEKERRQLIHDFNDTSAEIECLESKTIHSLFSDQVKKTPGNLAVKGPAHYTPDLVDGESLTYRMLNRKVDQLAGLLIKKGITNGDIIGIMVQRSLEMIVGMLSILKVGGAYLPIDSEYPAGRIKYMLRDSNAKLLMTKECQDKRVENDIETIFIDLENPFYNADPSQLETMIRTDDIAYIIYTSGSTGKPKGVMVEHRSIVNTLFWRKNCYQFNEDDQVMQIPSISFDSSVEDIFTPLISGSGLVLLQEENRYNVEYIRTLMDRNRITHFLIVPGFYKILLMEIPQTLKRLKSVTVAGEGFTEMLVKEHFKALPDVKMYNEYGPTENSVCSTVYEFSIDKTKVLIGKPITNVSCFIYNAGRILAPLGVYGELCLSGKGLARGYLNNPELTIEKFVDNPFSGGERMYLSGDLARWNSDGNIEFKGRIDHQVKIRGFRIELDEIKSRIANYDGVKEAAVVLNDELSSIHAFFSADRKIDISAMKCYLMETLPGYMIPGFMMQLEHMPLTPNGKIDRAALLKIEISSESDEYAPPQNEIQSKMVEIWSDVLGVETDKIGIHSNFFEIGGHSLKVTSLVSKIHKEFNVKISLVEVFKSPTTAALAKFIEEKGIEDRYMAIESVEAREYYPLSSPQRRFHLAQQLNQENTAYNIPGTIVLEKDFNEEKLEIIFKKLIRRHESMRTSFKIIKNEPFQIIHNNVDFKIEYFHVPREENITKTLENFVRPFNLNIPPLFRVGLINTGQEKILMVDNHHIISDGVSLQVLTREFNDLAEDKQLAPLPVQYKDYASWQNNSLEKKSYKKMETYWLDTLENFKITNLPEDNLKRGNRVIGNYETAVIERNTYLKIEGFCNNYKLTRFSFMFSIFSFILLKETGENDITIGTPVDNREHSDLENVIGVFLNIFLLRANIAVDDKIINNILKTNHHVINALENSTYPYEELYYRLKDHYKLTDNELFTILFNYLPGEEEVVSWLDTAKTVSLEFLEITPKYPLTIYITDVNEKLVLTLVYRGDLYSKNRIKRIIHNYLNVIEVALTHEDIIVSDLGYEDPGKNDSVKEFGGEFENEDLF